MAFKLKYPSHFKLFILNLTVEQVFNFNSVGSGVSYDDNYEYMERQTEH
jgi:hypothetical protein